MPATITRMANVAKSHVWSSGPRTPACTITSTNPKPAMVASRNTRMEQEKNSATDRFALNARSADTSMMAMSTQYPPSITNPFPR